MTVTDLSTLDAAVDEIQPGLVADRRHLHEHPELGMRETETATFVAARLQQLGLEDIRTSIANTGITALIRGTNPDGPGAGKVVLLRADMDALPILEENEVEYVSQNPGVMHACGHDAHTTMLMGTARILMGRRNRFAGTVKVLFQPAEEGPGGAEPMIAAGVMEDPRVDGRLRHPRRRRPARRPGKGRVRPAQRRRRLAPPCHPGPGGRTAPPRTRASTRS